MPSIRVRGSTYSFLRDSPTTNEESWSLASLFNPSPTSVRSSAPRPRPSLPIIRIEDVGGVEPFVEPDNRGAPIRRPRANTSSSRIRDHCLQNSRSSRALSYAGRSDLATYDGSPQTSPLTNVTTPHLAHLSTEGAQASIILPAHATPGVIENNINLTRSMSDNQHPRFLDPDENHHDDIVEHLDVIDSQIGAVSNLTNAANSILIPPLSWYSRKPVVVLPSPQFDRREDEAERSSEQFDDSLDRHVDDVLKRPSKIRRTLLGVWSFLKTPMGIITGIYGFLVVFWGAAIVVFLAKIINFHNANTQGFWVEVSSQVETGLFTVTSIGLIPSRVLDTYRIYKIWHYKRKTIKLRKKADLPQLLDVDDLPDPIYDPNYVHVLTEEEQQDLHRQQVKFQHHQTWYRAHGTETHRAFPINTALWICFLNDGNSIFQIFLCGTMWGLNRFERPPWTTGILIPASFLCGIVAAVLIWRGGEKTKRVEAVSKRLREALAEERPNNRAIIRQRRSRIGELDIPPSFARRITEEKEDLARHDSLAMVEEHMIIPPPDERQTPHSSK